MPHAAVLTVIMHGLVCVLSEPACNRFEDENGAVDVEMEVEAAMPVDVNVDVNVDADADLDADVYVGTCTESGWTVGAEVDRASLAPKMDTLPPW
jgi:DsbC/DsbD-like thiol-disulfide interchange protein